MEKTSPREVLLRHGKWIGSTDFTKLVARKSGKSERWSKELIADAYKNKGIRKHIFPDRTVIYGLTEFGPPTGSSYVVVENMAVSGGTSTCVGCVGMSLNRENHNLRYPKMRFEITQRLYDNENKCYLPPNCQHPFPSVGFNIWNCNDYPVRARVKLRMILGGRDLGLIPDSKGYYTGETEMPFGPRCDGLVNGNFTVPQECEQSKQELTLQVSIVAIGPDDRWHRLSPKSWTYEKQKNSWFLEPKVFVEEQWTDAFLRQ